MTFYRFETMSVNSLKILIFWTKQTWDNFNYGDWCAWNKICVYIKFTL